MLCNTSASGRMCSALLHHRGHIRHATHAKHHLCTAAGAKHAAAFLVVGSEILNGSIQDTNTPFLAKLLQERGIDLRRVEFIPDDVQDITASIHALKHRVGPDGYVFTSGGIGPTHDDVTYKGVASAFGASSRMWEACDSCIT